MTEDELPKKKRDSKARESYLDEEIGVKDALEKFGFEKNEILDAFGGDSKLKKTGEMKTTRRNLTKHLVEHFVTDDEDRRLGLIKNLYEKDFQEPVEDDNGIEEDIISSIELLNKRYHFSFPLPGLEEPEPETELERIELEDVQKMLGNETVFEHLLGYLGFKTDSGKIRRKGLIRYAVISDCDDFSLQDRQEILGELGTEGSILEVAKRLGLTPYMPKPKENETDIPEQPETETDIYNLENISEILEPEVFRNFKTMFTYKDSFTIKDIARFGVESKCDGFSLEDRDDFLEDFGLEGGIEQVAETFGLTPYTPKETKTKKPTRPDSTWLKYPNAMVNVGTWYQAMCKKYGPKLWKEIGTALYEYCKENKRFSCEDAAFMTRNEIYVLLATKFPELEEIQGDYNLRSQF